MENNMKDYDLTNPSEMEDYISVVDEISEMSIEITKRMNGVHPDRFVSIGAISLMPSEIREFFIDKPDNADESDLFSIIITKHSGSSIRTTFLKHHIL